MKSTMIAGALAAAAVVTQAQAAPQPATPQAVRPPEASIPFVNYGGIRDWQATDDRTLYVQDAHRAWYRATLFAPCLELPWAQAIGFESRGADRFDRFSSIVVRGERCHVESLTRSEAPPVKVKRKREAS